MKVKLLKKCRKSIVILNNYFLPAKDTDRRLMVVLKNRFGYVQFINNWRGVYYSKETSINKRRLEILNLAHETSNKLWYKICTLLK